MTNPPISNSASLLDLLAPHWIAVTLSVAILTTGILFPEPALLWLGILCVTFIWLTSVTCCKGRKTSAQDKAMDHDLLQIWRLAADIDEIIETDPEIGELHQLVTEANDIIQHGVKKLYSHFDELSRLSRAQYAIAATLAHEMAQHCDDNTPINTESCLQKMTHEREYHYTEIADYTDKLSEHVNDIFKLLDTYQELATHINTQALNASIAAARTKEGSKGFDIVAKDMQTLACHAATLNEGICSKVAQTKETLQQAQAAIIRTNSHAINCSLEAKDLIDNMVKQQQQAKQTVVCMLEEIREATLGMDENITRSRQLLLFEDIIREVLERTRMRINFVDRFIKELRQLLMVEQGCSREHIKLVRTRLEQLRDELLNADQDLPTERKNNEKSVILFQDD